MKRIHVRRRYARRGGVADFTLHCVFVVAEYPDHRAALDFTVRRFVNGHVVAAFEGRKWRARPHVTRFAVVRSDVARREHLIDGRRADVPDDDHTILVTVSAASDLETA